MGVIRMSHTVRVGHLIVLFLVVVTVAGALLPAQAQSPQAVPVMDGGAGPCSCELTVMTPEGKPAAAADVKVHVEYGFGGFHRLDLEAGANVDGKVRFTGLPAKVKRPPLEFRASKDQFMGVATFDPQAECQTKRDITLKKAAESSEK
jgi:hypothetical protein